MIHSTTYLLQLLRRQYVVKKQLFAQMKATAGETKKKDIARADDLLNDAARVRDLTAACIFHHNISLVQSILSQNQWLSVCACI